MKTCTENPTRIPSILLTAGLALLFCCGNLQLRAADDSTTGKTKQAIADSVAAAEDAGRSAAENAREVWRRIDEARLTNRTPDEIVAWVIMGVLVGAVAGMMTSLKPDGLGKIWRLLLGLAGAFLGGIIVHVGQFNFGWGPVLIRYEELLFSLVGAVVLVVIGRFVFSRSKKPVPGR